MKNRIIEIIELGLPKSLIQRENKPTSELIETNLLVEELNQALRLFAVSGLLSSTLFCVTKRYPRVNPNNRYDVDKRVVQLEIETSEPLSDEFYDALANLLSAYCG